MESKFKKGDIVRAKRSLLAQMLHLPIFRSEIMTVVAIGKTKYNRYVGKSLVQDDFYSVSVTVRDIDGNIMPFSQDNLEKL